jgi:hypothetical protein
MGERRDSIRERVILAWKSADKPGWSIQKTQEVCIHIDREFEDAGLCPAPKFHEAVKSNRDIERDRYIRTWVLGCHFPWLNPR